MKLYSTSCSFPLLLAAERNAPLLSLLVAMLASSSVPLGPLADFVKIVDTWLHPTIQSLERHDLTRFGNLFLNTCSQIMITPIPS